MNDLKPHQGDLVRIRIKKGTPRGSVTITWIGLILFCTPTKPNMFDAIYDIRILTLQGTTKDLVIFDGDELEVIIPHENR